MPRIKETIEQTVAQTVKAAIKDPTKALDSAVPSMAASDVAKTVVKELTPTIQMVTNNEPWWASRVTWGAILAALSGVLGVFGYAFPEEVRGKLIDLIIALGPVIAAGITLYGRWAARKPIGA